METDKLAPLQHLQVYRCPGELFALYNISSLGLFHRQLCVGVDQHKFGSQHGVTCTRQ